MAYLALCLAGFLALMLVDIPVLYRLFEVQPASTGSLWQLGR
jgi:hypothetical protein